MQTMASRQRVQDVMRPDRQVSHASNEVPGLELITLGMMSIIAGFVPIEPGGDGHGVMAEEGGHERTG